MSSKASKIQITGSLRIRDMERILNRIKSVAFDSLELDLSQISEIDTAGVQFLISLNKTIQHSGGSFSIINSSQAVLNLLKFYGLGNLLKDNSHGSP